MFYFVYLAGNWISALRTATHRLVPVYRFQRIHFISSRRANLYAYPRSCYYCSKTARMSIPCFDKLLFLVFLLPRRNLLQRNCFILFSVRLAERIDFRLLFPVCSFSVLLACVGMLLGSFKLHDDRACL